MDKIHKRCENAFVLILCFRINHVRTLWQYCFSILQFYQSVVRLWSCIRIISVARIRGHVRRRLHSEHTSTIIGNWYILHKSTEAVFIIPCFFYMVYVHRDWYKIRISLVSHRNPRTLILQWSHFADYTEVVVYRTSAGTGCISIRSRFLLRVRVPGYYYETMNYHSPKPRHLVDVTNRCRNRIANYGTKNQVQVLWLSPRSISIVVVHCTRSTCQFHPFQRHWTQPVQYFTCLFVTIRNGLCITCLKRQKLHAENIQDHLDW
jgi:hypothetical protein